MRRQPPPQPNYITREELEEILEEKFAVLEERLEKRLEEKLEKKLEEKLERKFEELEKKLDEKLDEKLAVFFGKLTTYYDQRFAEWGIPIEKRAAHAEHIADATQQRLERVEHEGVILGSHVDKHDTWIRRVTSTASRSI